MASAIREMKAISRQPTITAIRPPLIAPRAVASITFADSVSRTSRTPPSLAGSSVSGNMILAM